MSFKYCQFVVVACCTIALLMVDVTSSPVVRERRSDDAGPLELVVEKLTQQVNSLNTQLIEQANSFTAQLDSVNAEVTALKAKTATLETTVAFHALNNGNDVQTAAYGTIILSHVVTNIGNAYDPMTGMFTVPVSGLYDFQASILSAHVGTGQHAYAAIYVDSDRAALAISDTGLAPGTRRP